MKVAIITGAVFFSFNQLSEAKGFIQLRVTPYEYPPILEEQYI